MMTLMTIYLSKPLAKPQSRHPFNKQQNQPENCASMLIKRLFLLCSVPVIITGCAEFYDTQPPAPVYGNNTPLYDNKPLPQKNSELLPQTTNNEPVAQQPKPATPKDTVKTSPLLGTTAINAPKELKPEPLPQGQTILTPAQEQELAALQQQSTPMDVELESELEPKPKPKPKKPEPVVEQEPDVIEPAAPAPTAFQPLETFTPLSPVVGSLVLAANEDNQKGNVESATTTLERASRIEPRNATLYYKLALLKLKTKPSQAEDLAKKSAQLAANDNALKKHSWLLVAKARELQKDFKGAEEARKKASKF